MPEINILIYETLFIIQSTLQVKKKTCFSCLNFHTHSHTLITLWWWAVMSKICQSNHQPRNGWMTTLPPKPQPSHEWFSMNTPYIVLTLVKQKCLIPITILLPHYYIKGTTVICSVKLMHVVSVLFAFNKIGHNREQKVSQLVFDFYNGLNSFSEGDALVIKSMLKNTVCLHIR